MAKKPTIIEKLDLSHGEQPKDWPFTRTSFDPLIFPWPILSGSVKEAHSAYLFHRIPAAKRVPFMEELWRALALGGKVTVIVPYYTSARAIQDPSAEWPPCCETSFLYFNSKFRSDNKLDAVRCNFDFVYGYVFDPETAVRPDETRPFWIKHYTNAVSDLQLVLTKAELAKTQGAA